MNIFMLNPIALAIRTDGTYSPFSSDAFAFAGETTLLGMGMIFAVLAILWGVLAIFKVVFAGKSPKAPKIPKVKEQKQASAPKESEDDAIAAVIAASIQAYETDKVQNDAALVAILTAAVASYRASEGTNGEFRVVSFKRAGKRAWNSGR